MDNLKELTEYMLVLREENIPVHIIVQRAHEDFDYLFKGKRKDYYGIQQDGSDKIHITYFSPEHRLKMGALIHV